MRTAGRLVAVATATATVVTATAAAVTGCSTTIAGTPTFPGARLEAAVLTAGDFPLGVLYDRIIEVPGQPDGAGGPGPMLSRPAGCSDGLTDVIAKSAERGPGSAAKYSVSYDGARIVMTVLSWRLNLSGLAATAARCEHFEAFFDPSSDGIPMTTIKLPAPEDGALVYQQTMLLNGAERSMFMSFQNLGDMAVFGIAHPTDDAAISVKASLPQTFLDVVSQQADRARSA